MSTLPVSSFENSTKVPEGEPAGGALDLPPKARALHADIVGLIRAVRGRFD